MLGGSNIVQATPAKPVVVHKHLNYTVLHYKQYNMKHLEQLWIWAGGPRKYAHLAASIALAESSGNPRAYSSSNDRGLWQINGCHGYWSSFNTWTNVRAAIMISNHGRDWSPWATYTSGSYLRHW